MSDPILKPCPFCGGPAEFNSEYAGHSTAIDSGTWSVGCANQEVDCIAILMHPRYARKVEAAEAWNKRVVIIDAKPEI